MYEWFKALHIIFVVCWFAGIFYLPRLFVYHAMTDDQATREQFKIMERKLYRFVTPFAALTVFFGLGLAAMNWPYYKSAGWFHAKFLLVLILLAYHFACGYQLRQLANDQSTRSHVFFRFFNEAPVLLLFAIVILVVVRPF